MRFLSAALAAMTVFSPVMAGEAHAFKLFGLTIFGKDEAEDSSVPDPVRYDATLSTGDADKDLSDALENSSRLVSDEEQPVSGDLGVVVKARDDRDRLIATLYEKARYGGVVKVTIDGKDLDSLPPSPQFDRSRPIPVAVTVTPGPVFNLGKVTLEGAPLGRMPADYGLETGTPAGSLAIIKAGTRVVEDLKAEGRPLAKLTKREVIADHATDTVAVTLDAEGGPVAPLGDIAVAGTKTVRPGWVRYYSRLRKQDRYAPGDLRKANDRLRQLGTFSSVTVREAEALDEQGMLPITIEVSEAKRRYFGVGAQYSTTDGFGLNGYWGHRNLFGEAEQLRIEGSVGRLGETTDVGGLDYSAGITFTKPGAFRPSGTLKASIIAKSENPDAYSAQLITGTLAYSYSLTDQDTVSVAGEVSYEKDDDAFGKNDYLTFALPAGYERDARNDKFNPTTGYLGTFTVTPSFEAERGTPYASVTGSISGYLGLGSEDRLVLAGKIAGGVLVGVDNVGDIAATRRFFAGGGGSVRGYGYQEISPYTADDEATGGRSFATASFEARFKVTDRIGIVPFVDVGTVADKIVPDFGDIRAGAGIGLRYTTPFGPLRLDFAVPLNKYENGTQYGIYAGIGQSF